MTRHDDTSHGSGSGRPTTRHPVAEYAARVRARGSEVAQLPIEGLDAEQTKQALKDLTAHEAQTAALKARLVARARDLDIAADTGGTSTANWLAEQTTMTRRDAHATTALAKRLERYDVLRRAFAAGEVLEEQAKAIARTLDELPRELGLDVIAYAEQHLVDLAAEHDAKALRILGRKILAVVAPEKADAHEARILEKEEQRANAKAWFSMRDNGDGTTDGRFTLPTLQAAMLKKMLLAIAAPKHQRSTDSERETGSERETETETKRVPTAERMGLALRELIETYPADRLPETGGVSAMIVVTMTLESLLGGLKAAQLDTGEYISASEARRLACSAGIIPVVLGGPSRVLDLGRQRRLFNRSQRIALGIQQGGCACENCDWPPGMTHAHHRRRWADGGLTDLDQGILLCPRHHALAHRSDYEMTILPNGRVRFRRRK